jgi:ribokinase
VGTVVVVGSLNTDVTLLVDRLPKRGETVLARERLTAFGGKGLNQAVAAARQGAMVRLVGCVGTDPEGDALLLALAAEGVDAAFVSRDADRPTGLAHIAVDASGGNTIIPFAGANGALAPPPADAIAGADVVLAQLECPLESIATGLRLGHDARARTILNLAPFQLLPTNVLDLVDVLVANETEAAQLGAVDGPLLVVTEGERGARVGDRRIPSFPVDVVDPTGAGDAFCGTLAAALAAGLSLDESLTRAAAGGALACTVPGAFPSLATVAQVDELVAEHQA